MDKKTILKLLQQWRSNIQHMGLNKSFVRGYQAAIDNIKTLLEEYNEPANPDCDTSEKK